MIPLMQLGVIQIPVAQETREGTQRLQGEVAEDGKTVVVQINELMNELNKLEEIMLRKKILDLLIYMIDTIPIELKAEEAELVDY